MEDEVNLEKQTQKVLKKLDCVEEGNWPRGIFFLLKLCVQAGRLQWGETSM